MVDIWLKSFKEILEKNVSENKQNKLIINDEK